MISLNKTIFAKKSIAEKNFCFMSMCDGGHGRGVYPCVMFNFKTPSKQQQQQQQHKQQQHHQHNIINTTTTTIQATTTVVHIS
jgi:hypothetical protein